MITSLQTKCIQNWTAVVAPKLPAPQLDQLRYAHQPRYLLRDIVGPHNVRHVEPLLPAAHKVDVYIRRTARFGDYHVHVSEPVAAMLRATMKV